MKPKSIALFYREGSSDKVYQVELKQKGSEWVVNFAYGRRGQTLTVGTKTTSPVTYEKAESIFEALPKIGDVLEVRYLYAYPGGSLFQPISLGIRTGELSITDCDEVSELKFKTAA